MERIYHTWDKWECYHAGFYEDQPAQEITKQEAEEKYRAFLANANGFRMVLKRVAKDWPNSCEHYLSNERMNRIAWLGQAAACLSLGIPSCFRGGFNLLSEGEKIIANKVALEALNRWLKARGEKKLTMDQAQSKTQMDLY